jgi:hypothetical protein
LLVGHPFIPGTYTGERASKHSIDIEVAEDRGAILADFTIQELVGGSLNNSSVQTSRNINGGRPF